MRCLNSPKNSSHSLHPGFPSLRISKEPVPDHLWQAITARIEPQQLHVAEKRSLRHWLRITAVVCSLVLAVTLGMLYNRDDTRYSATLLSVTEQPALRIQAHDDYLQVEPLTLAAIDPGRSLELWAIRPDGKPVSLGVLPAGGKGRVSLSEEQQALLDTPIALAVSLEPQGGLPTGHPTGPVLYQGQLAAL
ncbi:hypothetical protein PS691_02949 [Pseudomonas fluorescens]|uniref:Anti-sigma K factor RskA C-terminal domain-containing protein n=1 Tax=Pseudomonas fluorescens TaxID=294 RepID=A0A5E7CKT7_PSEFL|nr:hypothetical protein PS691_02949 [Pseudomonas fluorescens]